jgi:hypothetical protein
MDITNLKESASKLKDDLSKNIINVNDINVFLDSILNDENAKTSPDILPSTDRPLTENDIIALFKSFLKTKCDSKGNLIKTWSVSEKLSSSELEDILKYANDNESKYFIDAATDYILDDYENISTSLSKKLIAEFYDAIGLKEKDIYKAPPVDENLLEDCINDLSINVNAKQLLSQSSIDDLTIYFETKYDIMPNFIYMINKDNNLKFLTDKQYTALDWLLESQGYTRNDLISVSKRNSSIFLKSLYEEINNHRNYIWYTLIAVPNTIDYAILLKLSRKGNVIIKKSTRFGLFNTHMNDACGINITLEKDIIVNKDTPITGIHLIYRDSTADTPCISGYKSPSAAIPNLRDTKTEDLEIYDKRNML